MWVCDHPEASRLEHLDYIRGQVDKHCWVVIGVRRHRYRPPYSYTVGLTSHGKPELVVTGLPQQRAADLLSDVAAHRQGDQLRIAQLQDGAHRRTPRRELRRSLQQVISSHIKCGSEGVHVSRHNLILDALVPSLRSYPLESVI